MAGETIMALIKLNNRSSEDNAIYGRRNLIINGAMHVWQRGTSADTASSGDYTCDRWVLQFTGLDGNVDWDQETSDTPDGFAYALKVSTDASETSLDAADYLKISQRFEGQNLQHLKKGASGAKKLSLSFWVKSSVASTYTIELEDRDNTRIISKSYTIDTADTWEHKSVVFEGDTSGSYTNDANESLRMSFFMDAGSNYTDGTFSTAWQATDQDERIYDTTGWLESSSPEFYLTGVQLEVGEIATPFEHRPYGEELSLCQRYYCHSYREGHYPASTTNSSTPIGETSPGSNSYHSLGQFYFPVQMRAVPTITIYNPATGTVGSFQGDSNSYSGAVSHSFTEKGVRFYANGTGASTNVFCSIQAEADAEL